tara:strand:+ start:1186 stop:1338 length:153 start_codon:yes stop_codon:yes gene_type:complete
MSPYLLLAVVLALVELRAALALEHVGSLQVELLDERALAVKAAVEARHLF